MKKIKAIFAVWLILMTGIFIIQSCEKVDPRPPCEINNVGTTTVKNSTGYNVWVDVTWGNITENYEKLLYNGNSYKYSNVPAGSIEIWVSFDGNDWYYEYYNLKACEDLTYTWYLSARKSTGEPLDLIINGKRLEAHRGCDHPTKTKVWNY